MLEVITEPRRRRGPGAGRGVGRGRRLGRGWIGSAWASWPAAMSRSSSGVGLDEPPPRVCGLGRRPDQRAPPAWRWRESSPRRRPAAATTPARRPGGPGPTPPGSPPAIRQDPRRRGATGGTGRGRRPGPIARTRAQPGGLEPLPSRYPASRPIAAAVRRRGSPGRVPAPAAGSRAGPTPRESSRDMMGRDPPLQRRPEGRRIRRNRQRAGERRPAPHRTATARTGARGTPGTPQVALDRPPILDAEVAPVVVRIVRTVTDPHPQGQATTDPFTCGIIHRRAHRLDRPP